MVKLPWMNHGNGATVYVSSKRPTPVFTRVMAYPPMRASTLATFDVVTTRPKTRSPGWTVVSLTATSRICGAAFGAMRGIRFGAGGNTAAVRLGAVGTGLGEAGDAAGACVTVGASCAGELETAARLEAEAPGPGVAGRDAWLQAASALRAIAIQSVGRARHI
jgi:hypothetical protein